MPSHAPLSTRDGRIRSSSVQQVGDPLYYSNHDIELLHQVVTLGQEILPKLHKRDRLPTTALFRAADIVFPQYGIDPDGDHKLSSIIFTVGGMRSTDNLLDRFRTVLSSMGIELEYIQEPSVDGDNKDNNNGLEPPSPARIRRRRRSSSRRSSSRHRRNLLQLKEEQEYQQPPPPYSHPLSPSTHSTTNSSLHERLVQAVAHSEAQAHIPQGRRRRNSDTAAELAASADADQINRGRVIDQVHQIPHQKNRSISRHHQRRRSDSQAPLLLNYKEHFGQISEPREPLPVQIQPRRASRPITPWLSEITQYTDDAEELNDKQQPDLPEDDDVVDGAEEADEVEQADEDRDYADEGDDNDYDEENDDDKPPSVDEYTRSLQMILPIRERKQHEKHYNHYSNQSPDDIEGTQDVQDAHLPHTHNYQHHQQLPLRTRPLPLSSHPGDAPPRPINSSMQAAGSWTNPESPRSAPSVASDNEEVYIPSDTTMQEELEKGPAPKVDPLIMAKVADTYFMRFAFLGGMAVEAWRTISAAHQQQEQYAAQIDREMSASEALLVWNDVAKAHIDDMSGRLKELQELRDERPVAIFEDPVEHVEDHVANQLPQDPANLMTDNGTGIVAAAAEIVSNAEAAKAEVDEVEADKENLPAAADVEDEDEDEDEDDEAAEEYRLRQEQRDRLMNRAARVYTITTLFNAVNHWHTMACEEVSRTKIARRHILRKKVFFAWRDQTASDYAKATTLTLGWFVQRWTAALRRVQHEGDLAVQFYNRDLVTVKFWTWFRAHQEQTATAWSDDRIKRDALNKWFDAHDVATSTGEDADLLARHVLLSTAGNQWIDQTQTQESILLRIEEQENETYMRAAVQDWAKECFCLAQLRAVQSSNDKRDKKNAFNTWRQSAASSQHRMAQLELDITDEYVGHWQRETRLAMFRADYEFDLKAEAVHSWILAEKLAFLIRYRDEQLLRKTCLSLKANFGRPDDLAYEGHRCEQEREDDLARTADNLYKSNIFSDFVSAFHAQAQDTTVMQETAEHIDKETLADTYICNIWSVAAAESVQNEELARRGAFYVGVVNSLDGWSAHARAVREERLRATYRNFRRQAKRQAAAECVAVWSCALDDVGDEALANDGTGRGGGYDVADELRYEHETHTIFATLNSWILETNDRLFQQSVAAEADTEVYLSRWRMQLAGCEELGAAAAEHDTVTQMAGRWDDWELQAVQARARAHTAAALHEKNDRRLGRRVLAAWQQQLAGPELDPELDNLQASGYGPMSMSVGRWPAEGGGLRTSASQRRLESMAASPLVARSDPPRGARPASSLLHPIVESPVTSAPVKRPLFSRGATDGGVAGSYSVPVPGGAPAVPAMYGPSPGAGPLRRLHRSTATAPAYNRTYQKEQEPEQPQPSDTPYRSSTIPSSSLATSATLTPGRDSHRHLLLQRRLQSAARLADSVQLGPMSEFDDYDPEFDQNDQNDDYAEMEATQLHDNQGYQDPGADNYADVSSEGDDEFGVDQRGPGSAIPPARRQLLSLGQSTNTPTRFSQSDVPPRQQTQLRRQTGFSLRKAAAATAATAAAAAAGGGGAPALAFDPVTTTPMGPLPSPFERRLRAAYGSQGHEYDDDDGEDDDDQYEERPPRRLAPITATPLRPLRMSTLSMPAGQSTARSGARVTFADTRR